VRQGRALVAGGGIGGLAAAIALRRAGFDVDIFERASEIREVGAGISLWANAIRALDRLGLRPAIEACSVAYETGGLKTADGTVVSSISSAELQRLLGIAVIVLHRADLLAALLSAVPASSITFGATCAAVAQDSDGVELRLADGRTVRGDVLVGADGLYSIVRSHLHGSEPPRYAGCTAWRSVVPFDPQRIRASETWGDGNLFGQVPISGNRVYWYAAKNCPEGERSPHAKPELRAIFSGWHEPIGDLIEAADESTILRNDIYDRPALKTWGTGRITLVGDAAHPMTPFLGQGACQALEDAVVLGECVSSAADVPAGLEEYERRRIPRANAFVVRSRRVGQMARVSNPILVAVRNGLLKRVSPTMQARQIAKMINGGISGG
jgi:2-polyprenyl-6-methoxyphenol hydroxylase-like FAD-dependent oxidoreductase